MKRIFRNFIHKTTECRICSGHFEKACAALIFHRSLLENYIAGHPQFSSSLDPVDCAASAPEIVRRMTRAATLAGSGPMAAVAGALAQIAAETAIQDMSDEIILENGGDIFMRLQSPARIGIYAGKGYAQLPQLAFRVTPEETPLAVCSSSGTMGHSFSKGRCELATVCCPDAALADAAATQAANMVNNTADIQPALEKIMAIEGVRGILIAHGGNVGMAGKLPALTK